LTSKRIKSETLRRNTLLGPKPIPLDQFKVQVILNLKYESKYKSKFIFLTINIEYTNNGSRYK